MARPPRQLGFAFRTWGGKRRGAGRKPTGAKPGVRHRPRPVLKARFPVHVTLRMDHGVWQLRSRRCFSVLARAFFGGCDRFQFRLVHYAVLGNHIHLLVEAPDERALSRAMTGLGVRIARGLNRLMRRRGRVIADRYHARILRTPSEVRRARSYLLDNARRHYGTTGSYEDRYASTRPVILPDTFLLRRLC